MIPIFITGCARSGTSLTAGSINLCGAWGGQLAGPNKNNARGMFENSEIRNKIVKPFLKSIGCDPLGQNPLPRIQKISEISKDSTFTKRFFSDVMGILKVHGYNGSEPTWFYKGAKMCLMWPIWHAAFPNAKWVIVRRDAEDIVSSCLRTGFMRAWDNRSGWLYWVSQHERRFEEMVNAKLSVQEIWPQRMIAGDFTEIQMVINNLGLQWKEKEVKEFVDPGLWRRWQSKREIK